MLVLTTGAAAVAGAALFVASGVSAAMVAAPIAQRTRRARAGMGYLLPGRCGQEGRLAALPKLSQSGHQPVSAVAAHPSVSLRPRAPVSRILYSRLRWAGVRSASVTWPMCGALQHSVRRGT